MDELLSEYADAEDPVAEVSAKFDEPVDEVVARFQDFRPVTVGLGCGSCVLAVVASRESTVRRRVPRTWNWLR
jgi:hypothetical protein